MLLRIFVPKKQQNGPLRRTILLLFLSKILEHTVFEPLL
jgi:hypothetical protein